MVLIQPLSLCLLCADYPENGRMVNLHWPSN